MADGVADVAHGDGSSAPEPSAKDIRLVITASSLGTAFEWYDFFIYGTLAASGIIGRTFFPAGNELLQTLLAWAGFAVASRSHDAVTLSADLPAQDGYPFPLRVDVAFTLSDDGLSQTVTATNLGAADAPWGTGPHPYLVAGSGAVDDWTLSLPATRVATVSEPRLLPTGVVDVAGGAFDFRGARVIADTFIDHAFTGLTEPTVLVTTADGTGVGMTWDDACPWVQIHTADGTGRTGLAVEPMTCPPDAFSTGEDVVRLAPGASHAASWRIFAV